MILRSGVLVFSEEAEGVVGRSLELCLCWSRFFWGVVVVGAGLVDWLCVGRGMSSKICDKNE